MSSRGQTKCYSCDKIYNNRRVPEACKCGQWLGIVNFHQTLSKILCISGGNYVLKSEKEFAPKILKDGLVSVRMTVSGRGSSLRVFVDTLNMMCYADACAPKYSTLSEDLRKKPWCSHLVEGVQVLLLLVNREKT